MTEKYSMYHVSEYISHNGWLNKQLEKFKNMYPSVLGTKLAEAFVEGFREAVNWSTNIEPCKKCKYWNVSQYSEPCCVCSFGDMWESRGEQYETEE